MKRSGLLNPHLLAALAELGHTDTLVIADAGLPLPATGRRIDLSVVPGLPGFLPVVASILAELSVEEAIIAEEFATANPVMHAALLRLLEGIPVQAIPHAEFKLLLPAAKGLVRTGECTPFSNVILRSGTTGIFAPALGRLPSKGTSKRRLENEATRVGALGGSAPGAGTPGGGGRQDHARFGHQHAE